VETVIQLLDFGMGAACLLILVKQRIPQRVTRLEKHVGLPPMEKLAA